MSNFQIFRYGLIRAIACPNYQDQKEEIMPVDAYCFL